MNEDKDDDLPLHNEARARAKWRGEERMLGKGDEGVALPASEVDNAAAADPSGGQPSAGDRLGPGLRPPD
jgi:hypothetical protein